MSWNFTEEKTPIITNNNNIPSITIKSSEDKLKRDIKINNSDIPSKYLGSTLLIDGNQNNQFKLIKKTPKTAPIP